MVRGLIAGVLAGAVVAGARTPLQRFEAVEPHMGTLVRITLYASDEAAARDAFRAAFDRIGTLDSILSDYREDSELMAVTRAAIGHPVRVSDDLLTVLRASQDLAEATGGAFDVTQGPVVRLWREARKRGQPPGPAALAEAAGRSGFRKLHVDAANRTVTLDTPRMALDVGAIGKGYAASEALRVLSARGVRRALVAVSGDLAFSEAPPGEKGWRIQVYSGPPQNVVPSILELTNGAVSTSGPDEQHLDANGRRYSHVIDPASGVGLVEDITVTVIAPHGLEADGLDTAVSVLGTERGLALIESRPGTAALVMQRTGESVTIRPSVRFRGLAARSRTEEQ